MTTNGQKACYVIDHLVEALGNDPSSSLRRAIILNDIDQYPGTTQSGVMERLHINKSALTREIDWLFNYGCIMRHESDIDGRAVKLETCGYSKRALESALEYFTDEHSDLKVFLEKFTKFLKQEKPTLRDAKIVASLFEMRDASKQKVIDTLYKGAPSTDSRAFNQLVEDGVISDA